MSKELASIHSRLKSPGNQKTGSVQTIQCDRFLKGRRHLGRSACRASQMSSEGELTGKLERPAGICPCDDAYARSTNRRVRIREVRIVQDVGGIQPYLNIGPLSQLAHLPVFGGADV